MENEELKKDIEESRPLGDDDYERLYEGYNKLKNENLKNQIKDNLSVSPKRKQLSNFEENLGRSLGSTEDLLWKSKNNYKTLVSEFNKLKEKNQ